MTDVRFYVGETTETTLLANSASVVKNWPNGDARARWAMVYPSRIVTPSAVEEEALNGDLLELGGLNFTWTFPILNEAMFHYLKTTKFSNQRRITATVYMRSRYEDETIADQWVAIVATAELPRYHIESVNPRDDKWYSPFVIKFFDGSYADLA